MKHDDRQYCIGKTVNDADVLADFIYLSQNQKLCSLHSLMIEIELEQQKSRKFIEKMGDHMLKIMKRIDAIEKHLGAKIG